MFRSCPRTAFLSACILLVSWMMAGAASPIRQHPLQPRYFEFRGKPTILITSGEHYGAVINRDFRYSEYLQTLAADDLNHTRIFAGAYVEKPGAFGIERNTLAPASDRFLAPWARSPQTGYAGGGHKFDLTQWNPEYFERLRACVQEASSLGIVIELTLFSSIYTPEQWSVNPFNPSNNINQLLPVDFKKLHTLNNGPVLALQEQYVRKLVTELKDYDNIIFEIQNEPWADQRVQGEKIHPYIPGEPSWPNAVELPSPASREWHARVSKWIRSTEEKLPHTHLISQNFANFKVAVRSEELTPGASILQFHYAYPEAVSWNSGLGRIVGCNETGFAGKDDTFYRQQAWRFILAGGGLFNHLDYSFSTGHEKGNDSQPTSPGGGGATLRKQFRILHQFIHGFDLVRIQPAPDLVRKSPGYVVQAMAIQGEQYAFYGVGRGPVSLHLDLPNASYRAEWMDPTGKTTDEFEDFPHPGGMRELKPNRIQGEFALRLRRTSR